MGDATGHLLFVPSPHGYSIQEREGEPPVQGDRVDLGEAGSFVVNRLGPSPYPDDERRCAYLLARVA